MTHPPWHTGPMNPESDLRAMLQTIRRATLDDREKCRRAFELVRVSLGFFKECGLSRDAKQWLLGQLGDLYEAAKTPAKTHEKRPRRPRGTG